MAREAIAIIGIGCRFPGAAGPAEFWQLLSGGVDAVTTAPNDRKGIEYTNDPSLSDTSNASYGGFLKGIDQFDPHFFGFSSEEAIVTDPQQRLLLEATWEALEDAGQVPASLAGSRTGIFVGVSPGCYSQLVNASLGEDAQGVTSYDTSIAANRISFQFNFRGPSLAINTACSSSLVAVHQACQSLSVGESNLAAVGGVNLFLSNISTAHLKKAGLISTTGRCRSFDASADGYVRSEGVGVVILKRLAEAKADGDRIYAVIRGSAINHNGRGNGLTAPNPKAQKALLREAYQQSGIAPGQVQYVEANGSGTPLGDSLELKSLGEVLSEDRPDTHDCFVGSVKTNIGNAEIASGLAGLIKVALALHNRQIPPNLHFQQPNAYTPFDKLPLKVPTNLTSWPLTKTGRIAGISTFGLGGTNAHVVLEGHVENQPSQHSCPHENEPALFVLSAKSEQALKSLAQKYHDFLRDHPDISWVDVCHAASTMRSHFPYRLAFVAHSLKEACDRIEHLLSKETNAFSHKVSRRRSTKQAADLTYPQLSLSPSEQEDILTNLAQRWLEGVEIDWQQIYIHKSYQFVSLPTYPFEHKSCWVTPTVSHSSAPNNSTSNLFTSSTTTDTPTAQNLNGQAVHQNSSTVEPSELLIDTEFVAPRNSVEEKLSQIWCDILNLEQIGVHDNFFELGGESSLVVQLFNRIKQELGKDLPLTTIFQSPTIDQLAQQISKQTIPISVSSTLIPIQASGSKPPLFYIPPAASTVASLEMLAQYLSADADQPLYALQHLGMKGKHLPHLYIEDMAAYYIQEIQTLQPQGPYYLFGRCLGGLIAFEMAQQLRKQGQEVALLGFLDTRRASSRRVFQSNYQQSQKQEQQNKHSTVKKSPLNSLISRAFIFKKKKPSTLFKNYIKRFRVSTIRYFLEIAQRKETSFLFILHSLLGFIPERVMTAMVALDGEARENYFWVQLTYLAHYTARQKYKPELYPGQITIFKTADYPQDSELQWNHLTSDEIIWQTMPGDHFTMVREPHVKVLADRFKACLNNSISEVNKMKEVSKF